MENIQLSKPKDITEAWWSEVCKKLKNAVVFIDEFVAESLHWSGGLERLIISGCKDVKEFSSFEVCSKEDEKAVFLLGGLVSGVVLDTLRAIIQASSFKYVVVITGAHSSVHAYSAFGGREVDERMVMNKIEEKILEWLGNLNYTVELFYFPLLLVSPTEDVFLIPQFHNIMPIFEDEISTFVNHNLQLSRSDKKAIDSIDELEFHHLPFNLRVSILHFISSIHNFLQGMYAREEIYSMGHLSRIVAGELETYMPARQRRKVAMNKVSLVFIDRTLDLVSPSEYDSSVLMSRILNILPRLPGHRVDSAIDLSSVSSVLPSCDWTLLPGCFAHPTKREGKEILEMSINCSKKETLMKINEELKKAVEAMGLDPDSETSSTTEEIQTNIKKLLNNDEEKFQKYFHLIQQGLGIIEVLKSEKDSHLDQLQSFEKMLLQSVSDPRADSSPVHQVIQLLKTREKKAIKIEEILALLLYIASLGGFPVFEETSDYMVINALSQAFIEDREKSADALSSLFEGEIDEVSALQTAQHIWKRLISISNARKHLKDYRELYKRESEMEPYKYESILAQVVEDCLNPPQNPISDLEYKSAGFKDIIKTGFSLFVNVSKPRPKDAALMMIYVLGGITPSEIHEVKKIVNKYKPNCEVVIGSSHLSYPLEAIEVFNRKTRYR